jgi:hypothetical protein
MVIRKSTLKAKPRVSNKISHSKIASQSSINKAKASKTKSSNRK